jgi:hypothetical protein
VLVVVITVDRTGSTGVGVGCPYAGIKEIIVVVVVVCGSW